MCIVWDWGTHVMVIEGKSGCGLERTGLRLVNRREVEAVWGICSLEIWENKIDRGLGNTRGIWTGNRCDG